MERSSSSLAVKECEVGCHEIVHYLAGGYWWLSSFFWRNDSILRRLAKQRSRQVRRAAGIYTFFLIKYILILFSTPDWRRTFRVSSWALVQPSCKIYPTYSSTTETREFWRCGSWHAMDSILLKKIVLWGGIISRGLKKEWMNFCMTTIGEWTRQWIPGDSDIVQSTKRKPISAKEEVLLSGVN